MCVCKCLCVLLLLIVSQRLDDGVVWGGSLFDVLARLLRQSLVHLLLFQVQGQFGLAFAFQVGNDVLVLPADLVRQAADLAVFAVSAQAQHTQCRWHADAAFLLVGRWDAVEYTQALQSGLSAQCLVWDHTCWNETNGRFDYYPIDKLVDVTQTDDAFVWISV